MTDHWLKSFRLSNICTNFIENHRIFIYISFIVSKESCFYSLPAFLSHYEYIQSDILFSRHVLSGVLMFYLILYSVFYLPWLSHVSYIQNLCYNILIHINIIMATCKQSRFDITGLKLHHTSFVLSAQVMFCKWLLLLLFRIF